MAPQPLSRKVISREYKFMLDPWAWHDPPTALEEFWEEVGDLARTAGVETTGKFDSREDKGRKIVFLDTPDFTLQENELVLRWRGKRGGDKAQFTLKCRNEDRYLAAGKDLAAAKGLDFKEKLEEDIAAPFASRFSHSNTITLKGKAGAALDKLPNTLQAAAELYPGLLDLRRDGMVCSPKTTLIVVNHVKVRERVFTGPVLLFSGRSGAATATEAEVALILWTRGKNGRPLVAEFSFRYGDKEEAYRADVAQAARRFFALLQRMDWSSPEALTKTQYVFKQIKQ